jgi:hypothetical protein
MINIMLTNAQLYKIHFLAKEKLLFLLWWDYGSLTKKSVGHKIHKVENHCISPYGVSIQKTIISIFTSVRTSNFHILNCSRLHLKFTYDWAHVMLAGKCWKATSECGL